jgi:hypothetical protein
MKHEQTADESSARALALIVAANGRIDERELHALDRLDAFRRLGVARDRFVELAHTCLSEMGREWCADWWLPPKRARYIDALLDNARSSSRQRCSSCISATSAGTAPASFSTLNASRSSGGASK